jgi:hypothetical protein
MPPIRWMRVLMILISRYCWQVNGRFHRQRIGGCCGGIIQFGTADWNVAFIEEMIVFVVLKLVRRCGHQQHRLKWQVLRRSVYHGLKRSIIVCRLTRRADDDMIGTRRQSCAHANRASLHIRACVRMQIKQVYLCVHSQIKEVYFVLTQNKF